MPMRATRAVLSFVGSWIRDTASPKFVFAGRIVASDDDLFRKGTPFVVRHDVQPCAESLTPGLGAYLLEVEGHCVPLTSFLPGQAQGIFLSEGLTVQGVEHQYVATVNPALFWTPPVVQVEEVASGSWALVAV